MAEQTGNRHNLAIVAVAFALMLSGCSSLGAAGPSSGTVRGADGAEYAGANIAIVDLDRTITARMAEVKKSQSFAEIFGDIRVGAPLIERGDNVGVSIWEAPPAVLFGSGVAEQSSGSSVGAQSAGIPEQPVGDDGTISIPFAGRVQAAGRTTQQVQSEIAERLRGRAHDPQILVRLIKNVASSVTVLGKVANTRRVPLTSRGERLLDVLAQAGGPTEDIAKTTVRLSRGKTAATMPLDSIILDPKQNVSLRADDVLTLIHQPYSFIALGAVARNAEVPFEGAGLTLAQALGRIGGLRDDRADIRGVFVFRFEDIAALDPAAADRGQATAEGEVPVIYRLDLSNASSLFVAQDFAIRDDDVLYVSSAPGADLQKFLSTLSNVALSTLAIRNSL